MHKSAKQLYNILPRAVCGRVGTSQIGYKCHTCSNDQNSIFCQQCFDLEKHKGHDYIITSFQGQCDCGDIAAIQHCWCNKHYGNNIQKDLQYYKNQGFDLEFCFIFISQVYIQYLSNLIKDDDDDKRKYYYKLYFYQNVLKNIVFGQYPVDYYRNCIVNVLFNSINSQTQQFPSDFLNPQFEINYISNDTIRDQIVDEQLDENIPLIAYSTHVSNIHTNHFVYFLEKSIAETIISTPIYRQGLCHYMPQLYDTIYLSLQSKQSEQWGQTIVQLYSSIRLTEYQSLVQQWTQYYWIRKCKANYLSKKQNSNYFQYSLSQDIINILMQDFHSQYQNQYCNSIVTNYQHQMVRLLSHFYQMSNLNTKQQIDWFDDVVFLQSDTYGAESLNHIANVGKNEQATLVTLLDAIESSQLMIKIKNQIIKYDYSYTEKIELYSAKYQEKIYYSLFISSLVGQEYTKDIYYLRQHQNFTRQQIDQSVTKDDIRINVAKTWNSFIKIQQRK